MQVKWGLSLHQTPPKSNSKAQSTPYCFKLESQLSNLPFEDSNLQCGIQSTHLSSQHQHALTLASHLCVSTHMQIEMLRGETEGGLNWFGISSKWNNGVKLMQGSEWEWDEMEMFSWNPWWVRVWSGALLLSLFLSSHSLPFLSFLKVF